MRFEWDAMRSFVKPNKYWIVMITFRINFWRALFAELKDESLKTLKMKANNLEIQLALFLNKCRNCYTTWRMPEQDQVNPSATSVTFRQHFVSFRPSPATFGYCRQGWCSLSSSPSSSPCCCSRWRDGGVAWRGLLRVGLNKSGAP